MVDFAIGALLEFLLGQQLTHSEYETIEKGTELVYPNSAGELHDRHHVEGLYTKLSNCSQLHCVQCMAQSNSKCSHNLPLTSEDDRRIEILAALLNSPANILTIKGVCKKCSEWYTLDGMEQMSCLCRICFPCRARNYKATLSIYCPQCDSFDPSAFTESLVAFFKEDDPEVQIPVKAKCSTVNCQITVPLEHLVSQCQLCLDCSKQPSCPVCGQAAAVESPAESAGSQTSEEATESEEDSEESSSSEPELQGPDLVSIELEEEEN